MSRRDPTSTPYRRCPCCRLDQPPALDATGVTAQVCAACTHHQGEENVQQLARAKRHEGMLRERLERCRASESQAQAEATEARERVAAALGSRGRLAARVVRAAEEAGARAGVIREIASDPQVIQWARREDEGDTGYRRSRRLRDQRFRGPLWVSVFRAG